MNISDLDISSRAYNALKANELRTVQDVLDFGIPNLYNCRNIGKSTLIEIERVINEHLNKKDNESTIILSQLTLKDIKQAIIPPLIEELKKIISEIQPHKSHSQNDDLLTREETANYLRISKVTLYKWIRKGYIKSYKISDRLYFKKSEILQSLNYENT